MSEATEERWFVCHTRPRCEKRFAELMEAVATEHYLPLVGTERRYGTRVRMSEKPLFTGYVFARMRRDHKPLAYQGDLAARIFIVEDEASFLRQLADVKALVASGFEITLHPLLRKGVRVRVVAGPLRGMEGLVDDIKNPNGIVIAMDVLQQGVHVKVSAQDLEVQT